MNCPFCQQELDTSKYYIRCDNPHCNTTAGMEGTEEIWSALELTYKALKIAVDTLKYIRRTNPMSFHFEAIEKALEQITALEQKE